jgi:hypothetical protein
MEVKRLLRGLETIMRFVSLGEKIPKILLITFDLFVLHQDLTLYYLDVYQIMLDYLT